MTAICSVGTQDLTSYLILVAVDTHLAVADHKRVDFCHVAYGPRSQYTVESPCKSVSVLFENLRGGEGRATK